jgi:hypothetical protein
MCIRRLSILLSVTWYVRLNCFSRFLDFMYRNASQKSSKPEFRENQRHGSYTLLKGLRESTHEVDFVTDLGDISSRRFAL